MRPMRFEHSVVVIGVMLACCSMFGSVLLEAKNMIHYIMLLPLTHQVQWTVTYKKSTVAAPKSLICSSDVKDIFAVCNANITHANLSEFASVVAALDLQSRLFKNIT